MKSVSLKLLIALVLLAPSPLLAQKVKFEFNNQVALNMIRGEIPAPIETTRFQDDAVFGSLTIDLDDLSKTTGTIKVDLLAIQATSFGDSGKNSKQTEHMKNWFEIGPEVTEAVRSKNRWAIFKINGIKSASPKNIKEAKTFSDEIGTGRAFQVSAEGEFTVHGITKPMTVDLSIIIYDIAAGGRRYKDSKRVAMIRTRVPIEVSLKEHGVEPRDKAGKFATKALSIIGLKIADTAKVSFDLRGYQAK